MSDQILLCVATAVVTAIVIFIGLNLSLGERQIDAPLTRLYPVSDPQFLRAVCSVITPAVVSGNRVEELINGDEICDAQDSHHWRDTHFRVEGPVVAQMQSAFIDNWVQTTGKLLHGDRFLPQLEAVGSETAQIFTSAPRSGSKSMQLLYLMSITASDETIDLSASYFLPGPIAIASLVAAAERGVRIRIIVPGRHMDKKLVRRASRASWGPLLAAGVKIFEFERTMFIESGYRSGRRISILVRSGSTMRRT